MNKENVKLYTERLMEAIDEETDPLQICPLCEKPASVENEIDNFVTLECTNPRCPIRTYTIDLDV